MRVSACALWVIVLVCGITISPPGNTKPVTCQMSLLVNCSLSEGVTCVKLFSCTLMADTPQNVIGVTSCSEEQETRVPVLIVSSVEFSQVVGLVLACCRDKMEK